MKINVFTVAVVSVAILFCCFDVKAEDDEVNLAKKLVNPVADLINVPFQMNYDRGLGVGNDGERFYVNIQPVVPIHLNKNWNLIARPILPVIYQRNVSGTDTDDFGTCDTTTELFFTPAKISAGGLIWGIGPVLYLATASKTCLGQEKWGIGPTAVVLKQMGPWTCGILANHVQSFAGHSDRPEVSATFLQPFLSYVTKTKTTFSLDTESTYDWENTEWSVPVHFTVSQLLKISNQLIQIGAGASY